MSQEGGPQRRGSGTIEGDEQHGHPRAGAAPAVLARGAAAVALGAALVGLESSPASAHGVLVSRSELDGGATYYEVTGRRASFSYQPAFHDRLATWARFWVVNTPRGIKRPLRHWSLGVHNDGRPSAAHNAGRGLDLTRIYATDLAGAVIPTFSGRYDLWRTQTGSRLAQSRRRYWATAASAHYHFRHVLTYPYDTDHWNHIHIDNLVSGTGTSSFDTGSVAQVLHVQACLSYVWGYPTSIDGEWGPQTNGNAVRAVTRAGGSGSLTTKANWLTFNRATMRSGYDAQTY